MATLDELLAQQNVDEEGKPNQLEQLLAQQNVDSAGQPLQAPSAPSPQQQALSQPAPTVEQDTGPSRLGMFLTGFGEALRGGNSGEAISRYSKGYYEARSEAQKLKDREETKKLADAAKKGNIEAIQAAKEKLKKTTGIDPNLIDNMSTEGVQALIPNLKSLDDLEGNIADRAHKIASDIETARHNKATEANQAGELEVQKEHYAQIRAEAKDKRAEKEAIGTQKRVDDTLDTLATVKRGASAGTFGMAAKRSVLAADGLRIIEQIKNGSIVGDPSIQTELATVMASALAGGNAPGEHAIKAFINRTGHGDAAKALTYLTSQPQSAITKAFLKQWEHQISGQDKFYRELRNNTIKAEWEKLKPSLDKNELEKKRFIRSLKAQYPEYDIKQLGEDPKNYGIGPIDISSSSDADINARIQELEAKKKGN